MDSNYTALCIPYPIKIYIDRIHQSRLLWYLVSTRQLFFLWNAEHMTPKPRVGDIQYALWDMMNWNLRSLLSRERIRSKEVRRVHRLILLLPYTTRVWVSFTFYVLCTFSHSWMERKIIAPAVVNIISCTTKETVVYRFESSLIPR